MKEDIVDKIYARNAGFGQNAISKMKVGKHRVIELKHAVKAADEIVHLRAENEYLRSLIPTWTDESLESVLLSNENLVDEILACWDDERTQTHSIECWKWHPKCAIKVLVDVVDELRARIMERDGA